MIPFVFDIICNTFHVPEMCALFSIYWYCWSLIKLPDHFRYQICDVSHSTVLLALKYFLIYRRDLPFFSSFGHFRWFSDQVGLLWAHISYLIQILITFRYFILISTFISYGIRPKMYKQIRITYGRPQICWIETYIVRLVKPYQLLNHTENKAKIGPLK